MVGLYAMRPSMDRLQGLISRRRRRTDLGTIHLIDLTARAVRSMRCMGARSDESRNIVRSPCKPSYCYGRKNAHNRAFRHSASQPGVIERPVSPGFGGVTKISASKRQLVGAARMSSAEASSIRRRHSATLRPVPRLFNDSGTRPGKEVTPQTRYLLATCWAVDFLRREASASKGGHSVRRRSSAAQSSRRRIIGAAQTTPQRNRYATTDIDSTQVPCAHPLQRGTDPDPR